MPHLISLLAASRYTAAPTQTTVTAVKSLHENIRAVLANAYETFLQGSYKNDTSIPDLNDVDIVAVRRGTYSTHFTGRSGSNPIEWETIFDELRALLEASHHYRGKTEKRDKCVNVATGFSADVVPAIEIVDALTDPIAIYSRSARKERKNSPRLHYQKGVMKQETTDDLYKPTVRMFKRWCRQVIADDDIAPSFYIECLIYGFSDDSFVLDPVERFHSIASAIAGLDYHRQGGILTVAGDKSILTQDHWSAAAFAEFQHRLRGSVATVGQATGATSQLEADMLWRRAFNE